MDRSTLEQIILDLAAESFEMPRDHLSLESNWDSVREWDSFAHVALVGALEEKFDLELPPQESAYFESLADMANALEKTGLQLRFNPR